MKFSMRLVFNTKDATDMALIQHLLDMVRTYGYKLMWYDYTTSGENNTGQLIYQTALNSNFGHEITNGEKTAFSISDNFFHLHVDVFDLQLKHIGKNGFVTYSLKGIVLPVEASTI